MFVCMYGQSEACGSMMYARCNKKKRILKSNLFSVYLSNPQRFRFPLETAAKVDSNFLQALITSLVITVRQETFRCSIVVFFYLLSILAEPFQHY